MPWRIPHRSLLAVSLILGLAAGCGAKVVVGGGDGGVADGGDGGVVAAKATDACGNETSGPTAVTGTLTGGTEWDAAHSPYVIAAGDTVTVASGATLTIDKCTKVILGAGASMHVDGHLLTAGTTTGYVAFTGDGSGRWDDLSVTAPGHLDFNYTSLAGGGLPASQGGVGATIVGYGGTDGSPITAPCIGFAGLSITDSGSVGILLEKGAYFTSGSFDLSITGTGADVSPSTDTAQAVPLALGADSLVDLPGSMDLQGKQNGVWVRGGTLTYDAMLYTSNVPFLIHGDLTLDAPLSMRAGVTLAFAPGTRLTVHTGAQARGAISTEGSATQPDVFTSWSDNPAAGDWVGVMFEGDNTTPAVTSHLSHVTIEYAGGSNGYTGQACEPSGDNENAALGFFDTVPSAGNITGLKLAHSPGSGIVEGFTGAPVDLKTGNTFTDVAECDVVAPMPAGGCPATPTCL